MGLIKKHTQRNHRELLNLLMILVITLLLSIGCSSSGGDDDDDDDGNDDDSNPIVGVWALKTTIEDCGDEGTDTTNFPYNVQGMAVVSGYVKLTSNSQKYYIKMTDVDSALEPYGFKNGTFSCSDREESYSMNGNNLVSGDGTTGTYTLSGDTLTLVTTDDENPDCTLTLILEKSDESKISNAEEDCDLFEYIDF